jgi:glycosyltransferase involved in cell wall biosynthesis
MTETLTGRDEGTAAGGGDGGHRLFLDATSALRWGPSVPTGIPRVEASLISEYLKDQGGRIDLFAFDPTIKRCRTLTEDERIFVRFLLEPRTSMASRGATPGSGGLVGRRERLRRAYSLYKLNLYCASRETYRSIAQDLLASNLRGGVAHSLTRVGVRFAFFFGRIWRSIGKGPQRRTLPDPLTATGARCLLSINTSPFVARYYADRKIGCRLFILNYDTIPLDYPDFASRGHAERFRRYFSAAMSAADEIICISETTRRSTLDWCARLGIEASRKRLHVVRLASPLAFSPMAPSPVEELKGKRFVVYCSTIEPRKNHQMLLRVWGRLGERLGKSTVPMLVLVGKWGWNVDDVRQLVRDDRHIADSVRVYPFLPDEQLIWLYANALFSVFPSIAEGWGLAASESLDFETPVLVSDDPALAEATQGLMPALDHGDPRLWEERVAELILDEAAVARLRERIRHDYLRRSPADVFRDISAILDGQVAARSTGVRPAER